MPCSEVASFSASAAPISARVNSAEIRRARSGSPFASAKQRLAQAS